MRRACLVFALGLALLATGCAGGEARVPDTPDGAAAGGEGVADPRATARAQALIESGNQAYRAGDYALAARRYASAAVVDKDDPAAYYGLGMALSKLNRDEDARVAYARARELSRQPR